MDELHRIHFRCIMLYIAVPVCAIALTAACARFLGILLPFWLVGAVCCLTPMGCAMLRLRLWRDRHTVFSEEEQHSRPVQIFFAAIPMEISFSVIAIGFILSG